MLRVFIYPVTALLGPFVQDAISATVKVGIDETGGLLPALTSSCESRQMESEADLVALRLLANAGIDPHAAIRFWEERLQRDDVSSGVDGHAHNNDSGVQHSNKDLIRGHSGETHSFIKTHPADEERIAAIRNELARWKAYSR